MKAVLCACLALAPMLPAADYSAAIPRFETAVRAEMAAWEIEGISVAWVDGTETVWQAGFGEAQADSVFRAGSVSKLFNAVAVMKLVEQGKLDLDAPVPASRLPVNPFPGDAPVTLRELLSHRSGLQREATVGGYFDDREPTLEATVASLQGSALVSPPDSENRYSNIGPSVAGQFVAEAADMPFPALQAEWLLKPLGMTRSGWLRREVPAVIPSHIRVADGKGGYARRATPLFDLGTIPAGNLYTTAGDLARFIAMLAAGGDSPGGRVLKQETLEAMWTPQLDPKGAFGLGFAVGEWRGHKTVGHGGAVYGHSTALVYLPAEKIGVVVLCNEDIVNGRTQALANLALALMLEVKTGEQTPAPAPITPAAAPLDPANLAGNWESQSYWLTLAAPAAGALRGVIAGQPCVLTVTPEGRLILDSRLHTAVEVTLDRDADGRVKALHVGPQQTFTPVPTDRPPLPAEWQALFGSYGPALIPLVIHEKFGRLYATTENMCDYRLTPLTRQVFAFPPGLYMKEYAVFQPGANGRPQAVDLANMHLPRLD